MQKCVASLFVMGKEEQSCQLRLGQVGGESLLLGLFNGQEVYFKIKPDEQDMIVPLEVPDE